MFRFFNQFAGTVPAQIRTADMAEAGTVMKFRTADRTEKQSATVLIRICAVFRLPRIFHNHLHMFILHDGT